VAIPTSVSLRFLHNGRLLPPREVRAAWAAHEQNDTYPTMNEVRMLCAEILPGARIKKHLLWRYSIVWRKKTVWGVRFSPTSSRFPRGPPFPNPRASWQSGICSPH